MGSQTVRCDWATERALTHTRTHKHTHTRTGLERVWPGALDFPGWNSFNTVWYFRVTAKPSYQWFSTRAILLPLLPYFPTGYLTMFGDVSGRHTWRGWSESNTAALMKMLINSRQCRWQPPQPRNLWPKMSIVMGVGGILPSAPLVRSHEWHHNLPVSPP